MHEDEEEDAEEVPAINKRSSSPSQVRLKPSAALVCNEDGGVVVVVNMYRPMYLKPLARLRIVPAAAEGP